MERPAGTTVAVSETVRFGRGHFTVMAGPCAVESRTQLLDAARAVRSCGAAMLRGGAFKPRTSPRSFQGLGVEGLRLLAEAAAETGLAIVTEVLDPRDVGLVLRHAAMLQVGSRNMQNFPLLRELGQVDAPVLLKRGAASTIDELLSAAEYVVSGGNQRVVLCERGIRSFDPAVRYTLDLAAVPLLQGRSPLPVVVDPSHGTGRRALVVPMALAALAAGADGLLVEVHPRPEEALCDGAQALLPADFSMLMEEIRRLAPMTGRRLVGEPAAAPAAGAVSARARAT